MSIDLLLDHVLDRADVLVPLVFAGAFDVGENAAKVACGDAYVIGFDDVFDLFFKVRVKWSKAACFDVEEPA